jgi:RNA polymerase sigma-70 factor (ECF subfamily)
MPEIRSDSTQTRALLERIGTHDRQALDELLDRHRGDLREFVDFHLDPRLRTRFDPSDVVQETQVEAAGRINDYLAAPPMPFWLWLRKNAYQRLLNLRRDHVTRQRRSVRREVAWPDRSSLLLARPLLAGGPSPSQQVEAQELAERLERAVARLADADRTVLLMRHAEDLPFDEIACLLGIEPAAARKRFGRALIRLRMLLVEEYVLEGPS